MIRSKIKDQKPKIRNLFSYFIFYFLFFVFNFSLVGCGERIESTSYYYGPSWTKDGDIIYIYGLQSIRKDAIGTQLSATYTETVMTMNVQGSNETTLFSVDTSPWMLSCSPSREYVGYLEEKVGDSFYKLVIRSTSLEAGRRMEKNVTLFSPERVRAFDWSPNGDKLVYCTSSEVRVRNWNEYNGASDQLVTAESDVKFVSWKYGNLIAFTYGSPEALSLISEDGLTRKDLPGLAVSYPQILPTDTNIIYGINESKLCKVTVSPATSEVVVENFKGNLPQISPDGKYLVYDKEDETSGIYLLNLNTRVETKVK
jgi:hypothetical protein